MAWPCGEGQRQQRWQGPGHANYRTKWGPDIIDTKRMRWGPHKMIWEALNNGGLEEKFRSLSPPNIGVHLGGLLEMNF
jgi:hypothetical protein